MAPPQVVVTIVRAGHPKVQRAVEAATPGELVLAIARDMPDLDLDDLLNLAMGETRTLLDEFTDGAARMQSYEVRETENERMVAQAAYDAELAEFTARIEEIRSTYGTEEPEEPSGGY